MFFVYKNVFEMYLKCRNLFINYELYALCVCCVSCRAVLKINEIFKKSINFQKTFLLKNTFY